MFFTFSNYYEDMKGELGIIRDLLGAKIFKEILNNPLISIAGKHFLKEEKHMFQ